MAARARTGDDIGAVEVGHAVLLRGHAVLLRGHAVLLRDHAVLLRDHAVLLRTDKMWEHEFQPVSGRGADRPENFSEKLSLLGLTFPSRHQKQMR